MRRWLVCAAWPYVNTIPHLGTFTQLLSADVFARYLRLMGDDVVSVSGSDEHGTPIEVEAIRNKVAPRILTDGYHAAICKLLEKYNLAFDNYSRTESVVHLEFVREFYENIHKKGHVFTQEVSLPYCSVEGIFLADRFVKGTCPRCKAEGARGDQCDNCGRILDPAELIEPTCAICGSKPTVKRTEHWFFDLPKFTDILKSYVESNQQLQDSVRNFSLGWLAEGLKPRALTRDNRWGVPAPFPRSDGKTIYVWMEAVLGYISATIEWAQKIGQSDAWKAFWLDRSTRQAYFIGKDNIPFHTIILPALLVASSTGYVLPSQISATEFILYEGYGKFSKSKGIGVRMDAALEIAPPEYWRFATMSVRPEGRDFNFTWSGFENRINTDLNDVLGNFIHRTLVFINMHYAGKVPSPVSSAAPDDGFIKELEGISKRVGELMESFRLREALLAIVEIARKGNQFLSRHEPWNKIKKDRATTGTVIYYAVQLVAGLAILLQPFMPDTSEQIWAQLRLPNRAASRSWAEAGQALLNPGHQIAEAKPIFAKISVPRQPVKV